MATAPASDRGALTDELWLSPTRAAIALDVPRTTLRRWLDWGVIPDDARRPVGARVQIELGRTREAIDACPECAEPDCEELAPGPSGYCRAHAAGAAIRARGGHTRESRAKMSASHLGKRLSAEHRAAISLALGGHETRFCARPGCINTFDVRPSSGQRHCSKVCSARERWRLKRDHIMPALLVANRARAKYPTERRQCLHCGADLGDIRGSRARRGRGRFCNRAHVDEWLRDRFKQSAYRARWYLKRFGKTNEFGALGGRPQGCSLTVDEQAKAWALACDGQRERDIANALTADLQARAADGRPLLKRNGKPRLSVSQPTVHRFLAGERARRKLIQKPPLG